MTPERPLSRQATIHVVLDPVSSRTSVAGWFCARCGHRWAARMHPYREIKGARPVACPRCKRRNWWIEAGILMPKRRTV